MPAQQDLEGPFILSPQGAGKAPWPIEGDPMERGLGRGKAELDLRLGGITYSIMIYFIGTTSTWFMCYTNYTFEH